ncbi:MAG: biotin--[acetyl-CoA-carboxylase] ligase [Alphaproteobacteria bacterium]|nr:biotin--[acetyl-CoA-carboxylase] ligase [Alphaproteobacteria bacterium]
MTIFVYKDITNSTNDDVLSFCEEDIANCVCVVAKKQIMGRGRSGRKWIGEEGNLYLSIGEYIENLDKASNYTFIAALSVFFVLKELLKGCKAEVKIKWPNDILINSKKCCGILLQCDGNHKLAIGVGININPVNSDELIYPVVSLKEFNIEIEANTLAEKILEQFNLLKAKNFSYILSTWKENALGIGEKIGVSLVNEKLEGTFVDLDSSGALLLKVGEEIKKITAGDVFFPNKQN